MASLSTSLLAVLEGQTSTSVPMYRQNILNNAGTLDTIWSSCHGASTKEKVIAASKTLCSLFKERAIVPEMPSYEEEQQKNWSVDAIEQCSVTNI